MSEAEMNAYRLTSMEEPGDERLAQIMREVAEEARQGRKVIAEKIEFGIATATAEAKARLEVTLNRMQYEC